MQCTGSVSVVLQFWIVSRWEISATLQYGSGYGINSSFAFLLSIKILCEHKYVCLMKQPVFGQDLINTAYRQAHRYNNLIQCITQDLDGLFPGRLEDTMCVRHIVLHTYIKN